MRAQQRRYDLWGAFILTMLPAVAGETLRDLLLGGDRYPPFIFKDPTYILIVISIVVVGTIFARFLPGEASHSPAFSRVLTVYLLRNRRKCASPNTIMWSRHSRRTVPISLSTYGFCHGDRGAVGLSRMPMARNRCLKTTPYAVSRSRIR